MAQTASSLVKTTLILPGRRWEILKRDSRLRDQSRRCQRQAGPPDAAKPIFRVLFRYTWHHASLYTLFLMLKFRFASFYSLDQCNDSMYVPYRISSPLTNGRRAHGRLTTLLPIGSCGLALSSCNRKCRYW